MNLAGLLAYDTFPKPSRYFNSGCEDWNASFSPPVGGFVVSLTATGIAPDFNRLPF